MADVFAVASGAWNSDIWATSPAGPAVPGLRPGVADAVMANDQYIGFSGDLHVAQLRNDAANGASPGGRFTSGTDGITITADVFAGPGIALAVEES